MYYTTSLFDNQLTQIFKSDFVLYTFISTSRLLAICVELQLSSLVSVILTVSLRVRKLRHRILLYVVWRSSAGTGSGVSVMGSDPWLSIWSLWSGVVKIDIWKSLKHSWEHCHFVSVSLFPVTLWTRPAYIAEQCHLRQLTFFCFSFVESLLTWQHLEKPRFEVNKSFCCLVLIARSLQREKFGTCYIFRAVCIFTWSWSPC